MTRSRRCCCCQDVFTGPGISRFRIADGKATRLAPAALASGDTISCDLVNKRLYYRKNDAQQILSTDFDLTNVAIVRDAPPSGVQFYRGLAVHPWNKHIFYGAKDSPLVAEQGALRRCDLDGANDVQLRTITEPGAGAGLANTYVHNIAVSRQEEFVFYDCHYNYALSGQLSEVRRCDADGSNDIQIAADTAFQLSNSAICVDNVAKRVFWVGTPTSQRPRIYVASFAGGGASELFVQDVPPINGSTYGMRLAGWSHERQRLYLWAYSFFFEANNGLWSLSGTGQDLRPEVVYPNIYDADPSWCKLGCGFEKTGPATLGS